MPCNTQQTCFSCKPLTPISSTRLRVPSFSLLFIFTSRIYPLFYTTTTVITITLLLYIIMADQLQQRPGPHAGGKPQSQRPSTSQVLAVVTLVPAGGILLVLSGLALAGSVIGLAVTTPLFVIFSPVLVPAAITIALAITGFLLSGAFGITALSSLSWIINHLRVVAAQMGQKTRELGQGIQKQAQQEGQRRG